MDAGSNNVHHVIKKPQPPVSRLHVPTPRLVPWKCQIRTAWICGDTLSSDSYCNQLYSVHNHHHKVCHLPARPRNTGSTSQLHRTTIPVSSIHTALFSIQACSQYKYPSLLGNPSFGLASHQIPATAVRSSLKPNNIVGFCIRQLTRVQNSIRSLWNRPRIPVPNHPSNYSLSSRRPPSPSRNCTKLLPPLNLALVPKAIKNVWTTCLLSLKRMLLG